jgi:pyridoxamine 5'-phosphate oxidase
MNFQDCITFANEHPVCYLATVDGQQTRVRTVLLMFANENGFYFETFSGKDMCEQMKQNPKVEICFYNNPAELPQAKQMRVTGEVEFVEDAEIKQQIYEKVKFLDDLAGRSVEPLLEIFRIKSGDAHFWTLMDVLKEPQLEHIKF